MGRLLLLIAIVVVVYLLIRSFRNRLAQKEQPVVENMVRCTHCGVHLPIGESVKSGGQYYCSAGHRDAHQK